MAIGIVLLKLKLMIYFISKFLSELTITIEE